MRLAGYVPTTTQHAASYMASDQSISIFSDLGTYLLQHNMQYHIWPLIKVLVSFQTWVRTYYNISYMAPNQSISIFSVSVYIQDSNYS